jgi:hypothetical protein
MQTSALETVSARSWPATCAKVTHAAATAAHPVVPVAYWRKTYWQPCSIPNHPHSKPYSTCPDAVVLGLLLQAYV